MNTQHLVRQERLNILSYHVLFITTGYWDLELLETIDTSEGNLIYFGVTNSFNLRFAQILDYHPSFLKCRES